MTRRALPVPLALAVRVILAVPVALGAQAGHQTLCVFMQALLPDVFEALGVVFGAINGRLRREGMRSRVLRVLSAWTAAAVFPQPFINGLTASFFREAMRPAVDPQEAVSIHAVIQCILYFVCAHRLVLVVRSLCHVRNCYE
jgi:hypothetical protein